MKIVICWSSIAGYWGACWRSLASRENVDLFVLAFAPRDVAKFDEGIMDGLEYRLLDDRERGDVGLVYRLVTEQEPNVLVIVGWFVGAYRALVNAPELAGTKKFISVDTPWRHEFQYLTRLRYRRFFRALDGAGVTGERSWQYVKRLGFTPRRIRRHVYGVDDEALTRVFERRSLEGDKGNFLFIGRYTEEKGLDVLVGAYRRYRERVDNPRTLTCCGSGPLKSILGDVEGIVDRGFVQPAELAEIWLSAGVFVLPSRFDPWPLVLVEAAMSGLPLIASEACGSAVEILRDQDNGFLVSPDDPEALAHAMVRCHDQDLAAMGARARQCSEGFGAGQWADRWLDFFTSIPR